MELSHLIANRSCQRAGTHLLDHDSIRAPTRSPRCGKPGALKDKRNGLTDHLNGPAGVVALIASLAAMVIFEIGDVLRNLRTKAKPPSFIDSAFDLFELSGSAWMFGGLLLFGPWGMVALPAHVFLVVLISPFRVRYG